MNDQTTTKTTTTTTTKPLTSWDLYCLPNGEAWDACQPVTRVVDSTKRRQGQVKPRSNRR